MTAAAPLAGAAETRPPLVSLRRVSKAFPNGTLALRDLDLDVRPGEFLSLLGPLGLRQVHLALRCWHESAIKREH